MTPAQLKAWRLRLGWTQVEAAKALGVSVETISAYERGNWRRAGGQRSPAEIPKSIRLACAAIALGLEDYPSSP